MTDALTSHLVSGTPELQFAIDEVPTAEAVATVVHVVQSEPSAADRGLEVLAALADDEAKYWREATSRTIANVVLNTICAAHMPAARRHPS